MFLKYHSHIFIDGYGRSEVKWKLLSNVQLFMTPWTE